MTVLFTVKLILLSSDKEYINANPWIVNTWSCVISTLAAVFDGDINFVLLKLFWTDIWSFSCNHAFCEKSNELFIQQQFRV